MIIENSDALKVWLTSCLGRMCDADPAALAKYVLALVKKEKTENELREFCLDQLEVFLLKDTKQFVDLLFETLKTKSYLHRPDIIASITNIDTTTVNSSKKLNLPDSKEKGDSEKEKDSPKSENVPKLKPVHFTSNSRTHTHTKGVSGHTSRERRERNHRSRSHSSSSHSSRSSSRERLKEKCESPYKHKTEERPREILLDGNNFSHAPYHLNNIKGSNRCKDYDEKGYCMQGDLCLYDHGTDPVVLENVSVINFGGVSIGSHVASHDNNIVSTSLDVSKSPLPPPPPTSPPPLPPPPPPPPPPLPVTGAYIPEPYNPEAPAMNITSPGDVANYWVPSNIHIPSIHHPRSQQLSGMSNSQHIVPQHNSKPRTRELIGVPTVEVTDTNKNICLKPVSTVPTIKKRKGFDYSRLGPKPKRINSESLSRTLELKRVPKHLNTIALLNSHFSKFGNITNIEVFYNGDPEAALIQFQTHSEAAVAHSSTDAVLNNRFIQVFWHNKEEKNIFNKTEKLDTLTHKYKHVKEVMSNNSEIISDEKLPSSTRVFNAETNVSEKVPERSVVYSRGNICRTVFNPAVLKKVDNSSVSSSSCQKEEKKVNKRLELYKKKQDFLESQMKHQKIILAKLSTAKNDKDRALLKKMLDSLLSNIKECQRDLKDFLKQCNSQKTPTPHTKSEAEKLLLDAEMDLYNTLNKCDGDTQQDTAELLLLKVNELKQKAKAFGLLDSHLPSHEVGLKAKRRQLQFPKSNNTSMSLKIDNRPKTLLISGVPDKDILKKHFQQFGDIEKIDDNKLGTTVTFKTRKAAEMAFTRSKLGDENLSVSWFLEDQHSASEDVKDANILKVKSDDIHFVDGDEDEDEEEDSEARSWRR